jgi:diphthine methyl ester synthase
MTLHIIGIGLSNPKDITVKGFEIVKKADIIYLEAYTSKLNCSNHDLATFYDKQIILAHRAMVEGDNNEILENAKDKDVAFLVVGDPFSATTHLDLMQRAKAMGITVRTVNNASILNAVGVTGLQLYKFGKTTSVPYPEKNFTPQTAYEVIKMNKSVGLHTLCLLDIKYDRNAFMTVNEAIHILWEIEEKRQEKVFSNDTFCVGVARVGSDDCVIISGTASDVAKADFGLPLHCLIVPGKMHFMEEESLEKFG